MAAYRNNATGVVFPMSRPYSATEQARLVEQGIPPAAAHTIAVTNTWQWVFAIAGTLLGLAAIIWLIVISTSGSDPSSGGSSGSNGNGACKTRLYNFSRNSIIEVDTLYPNQSAASVNGTVQDVAGFLFDVASNLIGNTTGFCVTSDSYYIKGVLFYEQTCTQVYNFFDRRDHRDRDHHDRDRDRDHNDRDRNRHHHRHEDDIDSIVTEGQYLTTTGNGTTPPDTWSITGGTGKFLGAFGVEYGSTIAPTEIDGYFDNFLIYVPCIKDVQVEKERHDDDDDKHHDGGGDKPHPTPQRGGRQENS